MENSSLELCLNQLQQTNNTFRAEKGSSDEWKTKLEEQITKLEQDCEEQKSQQEGKMKRTC